MTSFFEVVCHSCGSTSVVEAVSFPEAVKSYIEDHKENCESVRTIFESNPNKATPDPEQSNEQIVVEYDLDDDFHWRN